MKNKIIVLGKDKLTDGENISKDTVHYFTRNEIIRDYLSTKDGSTREQYKIHLQRFFIYVKRKNIEKITLKDLSEYKEFLKDSGLKTNTVNTYLSPLRDMFSWLCEVGYLYIDPSKSLRHEKHKDTNDISRARALTVDETTTLMKATSKGDLQVFSHRIMMLLMFNLGLRVSEVMKIKVRDLNMMTSDPMVSIMGKGSKRRILGLNDVLRFELNAYLELWGETLGFDDYLIQSQWWKYGRLNTKPATTMYGRNVLNRYAKKAGLEPLKTHSCRATAINTLLDLDIPLRNIANFAGHSSIETTRTYDRKDQAKVLETCNKINIS